MRVSLHGGDPPNCFAFPQSSRVPAVCIFPPSPPVSPHPVLLFPVHTYPSLESIISRLNHFYPPVEAVAVKYQTGGDEFNFKTSPYARATAGSFPFVPSFYNRGTGTVEKSLDKREHRRYFLKIHTLDHFESPPIERHREHFKRAARLQRNQLSSLKPPGASKTAPAYPLSPEFCAL